MITDREPPPLALSVRQPWAWAIVSGGKDIENRDWRPSNAGRRFKGMFAVHAASGMTRDEYESARDFMASIGVTCPHPDQLVFGAIIGEAFCAGFAERSPSPWFMGPGGLILQRAARLRAPVAAKGALGFFRWTPAPTRPLPKPWMRKWEATEDWDAEMMRRADQRIEAAPEIDRSLARREFDLFDRPREN